jgi:hypothetical protein
VSDTSLNTAMLATLNEALDHIDWLTRHAKTTESGNALGVVTNAKAFLERPDIHQMRVLHAQFQLTRKLAAERQA